MRKFFVLATALEDWKSLMVERSQFNDIEDCNPIICHRDYECDAAIAAMKNTKFM